MRINLFFLFLLVSVYPPASGNDGFGALGVGGIVVGKTDDIALVKEVAI